MILEVSLAILILLLGLQIIRRFGGLFDLILRRFNLPWEVEPPKIIKYIFLFSIFSIFILLFYQSFQQYQFWSQNEVSQYLLPPHQSINYFIFYSLARFFASYLISLAIAILFLISAKTLNKKYQERFFEPEEPYFGALAIFLVSHPGWILYIIAVILIYLFIQIFTLIYYKFKGKTVRVSLREVRVSLRYVWLPAAIFVIIISKWLALVPLWNLLKI